ncbi:MAG: LLM class oxidoreductase [Pseudomonadota bacterium]
MVFPTINKGFNRVFRPGRLSLGLVVPIEHYGTSPVPEMQHHLQRVQLAESLGFSAVWLRDVPFNVPSFNDAGQLLDPFVYLGYLAGHTSKIALGVASIILPLRHPVHVAKASASIDVLSGGRVILGIASGDRPEEYPAMGVPYPQRGELFRESYDYIRGVAKDCPHFDNAFGKVAGYMDLLPKPYGARIPLLITGSSQQSTSWLAGHGDGWITYPRPPAAQAQFIHQLRSSDQEQDLESRPVMEPLYIDIADDPDSPPQPIHLGFRLGTNRLREYLLSRQEIGVNHVALNLRFNNPDIEQTLRRLASDVLPLFTE